ncbi:MAG: hypothetical protein INQ03_02990 [Candidatus Heimdallarchaeota archaeon]|nr:hypothetical protein [Candidatus Heimdallarchaeota archaeon]
MEKESLEYKLNLKYRSGQISKEEYDQLLEKFRNLGMLDTKPVKSRKIQVEGSKAVDEIKIDGPVLLSGGVVVNGPVECNSLSTSGSVNIVGNLIVKGQSGISGEIYIDEGAKFVGPVTVTGSLRTNDKIISASRMSVTGTLATNDITLGDKCHVVGKLLCSNLKSSSHVTINGSIKAESILAESFTFKSNLSKAEKSDIDGDVRANEIDISAPLKSIKIDVSKVRELKKKIPNSGIKELDNFLGKTIDNLLPSVMEGINEIADNISAGLSNLTNLMISGMTIGGNIEGTTVILEHCIVVGDITADNVKLGPNVKVHGRIFYRYVIQVEDEEEEYVIEQISD